MKKFLLGTVALVAFAAPALAADLGARTYTKAPAYAPAPIYNWTGFYIGGHVGGAFVADDSIAAGADRQQQRPVPRRCPGRLRLPVRPELGARCRSPVQLARQQQQRRDLHRRPYVTYTNKQTGLGSVTGRLGYTWGPALLYAKGGYAFADYNESLTLNGAPVAFAKRQPGRLHRRWRPRIPVHPELVGQGSSISTTTSATPASPLAQHLRPPRTTSTPSRPA